MMTCIRELHHSIVQLNTPLVMSYKQYTLLKKISTPRKSLDVNCGIPSEQFAEKKNVVLHVKLFNSYSYL